MPVPVFVFVPVQEGKKVMQLDTALAMWQLLYADERRWQYIDDWCEFLQEHHKGRTISRDTWAQLFEFARVSTTGHGQCNQVRGRVGAHVATGTNRREGWSTPLIEQTQQHGRQVQRNPAGMPVPTENQPTADAGMLLVRRERGADGVNKAFLGMDVTAVCAN